MEQIDLKKNMAQLLREFPQLEAILGRRGINCGECLASQVDTLADVARMYHLNLESLIQEIRAADSGSSGAA